MLITKFKKSPYYQLVYDVDGNKISISTKTSNYKEAQLFLFYFLKEKNYRAKKVNQVWGTDMTKFYVDTVGWLYFVVVLDWFTKKIVGWDLSLRSKSEQWIDALNQAVEKELTQGSREYNLMLISDNGSQPTSIKYEKYATHCALITLQHHTQILKEMLILKEFLRRSKKK